MHTCTIFNELVRTTLNNDTYSKYYMTPGQCLQIIKLDTFHTPCKLIQCIVYKWTFIVKLNSLKWWQNKILVKSLYTYVLVHLEGKTMQ